MEAIFGFVVGVMSSWIFLILVVLFGIISENNSWSKMSIFLMILTGFSLHFIFSFSTLVVVSLIAAYLIVGLAWSVYRYKRHVMEMIQMYKNDSPYNRRGVLARLHPTQMVGNIVSWIVSWPFSAIVSISGDIIDGLQALVTTTFRKMYLGIFASAQKSLNPEEKDV